jgi:Tfp pilus assembly protein PilF
MLWHRRRPEWIEQSLATFEQALAKDPDFALAHIGIAECYIMLSGHRRITMQEAETKARPEILRALELDDSLAMGHNALAELKYQYEYDWRGAEQEFTKAIDLNPNVAWIRQAYGWFLMSEGRFDEAAVEMDKARQFDPNSLTINVGRGRLYYYSRQYDQAMRHYENILAVEPNDYSSINSLYTIYEQKGMYPEALEAFIKGRTMEPGKEQEFRDAFNTGGWQAFLQKQLAEAERIAAMKSKPIPWTFANIYARLGDKDKAFFWLEKVFEERDPVTLQFKIEPAYDSLRDDPRYARLLAKIGLQP